MMSSAESECCSKPEENFKLLKQGAEAKIYVCTYLGMPTVVKERFVKKYRHADLDSSITKDRIRNEARSIVRCKNIGIRTPCLYLVDMERRRIYMEHFSHSITLKDFLITIIKKYEGDTEVDVIAEIVKVAILVGVTLSKLHNNHIIHGDLTTSNMLLVPNCPGDVVDWLDTQRLEIALIDFGLSYVDSSPEDKAVDLYVLERALISTHNDYPNLFEVILKAYCFNNETAVADTLTKFDEVRARGRKRTMVG